MQDCTDSNKFTAYRMLIFETAIISVIALLMVLGISVEVASSVLVGGLAFIIPNAYFTRYVFRYSAADSPQFALKGFYLGELIKFVTTVLIFTLGFLLIEKLNVLILVLTYISTLTFNLWGNSIFMHNLAIKAEKMKNKDGD